MSLHVLTFDPGSSSLKFGLYQCEVGADARPGSEPIDIAHGAVERLGQADAGLTLVCGEQRRSSHVGDGSMVEALEIVLRELNAAVPDLGSAAQGSLAFGCRVVHGGEAFSEPVRVGAAEIAAIRELIPLAPLHNRVAADVLETCLHHEPSAAVIAVFDTAFHRTLPQVAKTYGLPHELSAKFSLQRYGFHGIAHQYVSETLFSRIGPVERLVTCHLGSGASICAIKNGKSIDISMGMTPMEGLLMGKRCGDLDPGLLLYLQRVKGFAAEDLDRILNFESGILGVSGVSADLRDVEKAAAAGNARATLAIDLFAYRVSKYIGAMAAVLEGIDAVAFSGGIGERSASMRARICKPLAFLGLTLEDTANIATTGDCADPIAAANSRVGAWVIPADEDLMIARAVVKSSL